MLQNYIRWQDINPTNTVKTRIHIQYSPNLLPEFTMNTCLSLEDDNSPSVGNNPTVDNNLIGEGSEITPTHD